MRRGSIPKSRLLRTSWRWLALLLALWIIVCRFSLWVVISRANSHSAAASFNALINERTNGLKNRFDDYASPLYAARGYVETTPAVTGVNWNTFITDQHLPSRYSGVLAADYLNANEQSLIGGGNNSQANIKYIAPDSGNQTSLGKNVAGTAVSATILSSAASSATPYAMQVSANGQPTTNSKSPYLLVALPFYSPQSNLQTASQRLSALRGYVALLLNTGSLFSSIFTGPGMESVAVNIDNGKNIIYTNKVEVPKHHIASTLKLNIAGQTWQLNYIAPSSYGLTMAATWLPPMLFISGLPLLILCVLVVYYAKHNYQLKRSL